MQKDNALIDPAAKRDAEKERPIESAPGSLGADLGYAGRLIGAYFRSEPLRALLLLAVILGSGSAGTFLFLRFQVDLASITNALVAKNAGALGGLIASVLANGAASAVLGVVTVWANLTFRMRFRTYLVENFLRRWVPGYRFFHLEQRSDLDHPEQRIQEDTYLFLERLMTVGPGVLMVGVSLFLYSGQLWRLSPPLTIEAIGMNQPIPGFLLYVALGFGVIITLVTHLVGSSLTRAEVVRQRLEAQFRHEMAAVRQNAEAVAFARGAGVEHSRLLGTFNLIRKNWRFYTWSHMKINFVRGLPEMIMVIAPTLLLAPFILKRQMQIGDIALVAVSFGQVYLGVGILATFYDQLAILRSSVARLRLLSALLSEHIPSDIKVTDVSGREIRVRDLMIAYPDGTPMTDVGDLTIGSGDRLLIQGRSGAGKSTLLRAIAGLWPYGQGEVAMPKEARIAFLPQRGYMPDGSLASLMSYPRAPDAFSDETYVDLLNHFGLGRLAARLHDVQPWGRMLSPGEQQRISAARAILTAPDILFVDEATSALDTESEATLYGLIAERLPDAALVSIAHRPTVSRYHDTLLRLEDGRARLSAIPASLPA